MVAGVQRGFSPLTPTRVAAKPQQADGLHTPQPYQHK